ncbi:uncharacterized protein L969DRAFT_97180 [Mixia osmundae IAM 14324]|uniref:Uncharacterized protein n=1 Tax=Mixia osmundae (strain CBS 9802 / IAM 14324 / JCM 22182 / KY 12970) TaxID=764103 RepID=G7DW52_MIXOS|nr:uncharacterized protein L969DRAFT_97180 [Mixia osmundae IAM 14324]KEI36445.1 hypothetical protein L969DRAFT_97180 [Mixia osmundae IAM 14324]GAA94858.1 hypothetical protein E5Q_01512 [Mixia osmundae IAM 14324]
MFAAEFIAHLEARLRQELAAKKAAPQQKSVATPFFVEAACSVINSQGGLDVSVFVGVHPRSKSGHLSCVRAGSYGQPRWYLMEWLASPKQFEHLVELEGILEALAAIRKGPVELPKYNLTIFSPSISIISMINGTVMDIKEEAFRVCRAQDRPTPIFEINIEARRLKVD